MNISFEEFKKFVKEVSFGLYDDFQFNRFGTSFVAKSKGRGEPVISLRDGNKWHLTAFLDKDTDAFMFFQVNNDLEFAAGMFFEALRNIREEYRS